MKNSFNDLGITPPILKALEEMNFKTPTEVQSKAIPHILNQKDLIVKSKTGSGKTAVFGVSILQLTDPQAVEPQGLILTPTRELAVQVSNELKKMSKHLHHRITAVYGQHNINYEVQDLKKGSSIVSGTPGRVFDHIQQGNLKTGNIRFLVLDEADRMLDMGFLEQVVRIIKTLPQNRVTLLFSATIPPKVHKICRDYMKHPITIEIESKTQTVDTIHQVYYRVKKNEKNLWLNRLLLIEQPESCIIFCNTRMAVDRVQDFLTHKGYACQSLHGDIPQSRRMKTMQQFKHGDFHILVATDVAARGIHIDDLALVVNYDVPNEKDNYVHRIGRTGRAGNSGRAITLVTGEDIMSLYEIEEHISTAIPETELPTETAYNECRVSAEKWVKANSPRNIPYRAGSKPNTKTSQDRYPQSNMNQNQNKHRSQPQKTNTDYKKHQRVSSPYGSRQTNTVHRTTHSAASHKAETNVLQTRQNIKTVQVKDSTPKKPFLKRVLQRIFGK